MPDLSLHLTRRAALALLLLCGAAQAEDAALPRERWPRSVAEAVPLILADLRPPQRALLAGMPRDNLFQLLGEWGADIEHDFGMRAGNTALVQAACGGPCAVEQATLVLMEATWVALPR